MKIGAHVSAAGGIEHAVDRIADIGGNCLQIFISSPRGWRKTEISDEQVAEFKQRLNKKNIGPVFIHALYLANLATDRADLREKSIDALAHALTTADRIGAEGVIYHIGSKKDRPLAEAMQDITSAMKEILKRASGNSKLIVEGSAGQNGHVGSPFEEVAEMLETVNSDRVSVCLDSCHMFQAGYDLRSKEAVDETLAQFDTIIGGDKLIVMHANDAKAELDSGLDRHENIGEGYIGTEGFTALLTHPKLKHLPWILEVPGFDGKGSDKKNIDILKRLAT